MEQKTSSWSLVVAGTPPQPLPQSEEKYVTPAGETKEKSQTPSIAPMMQSLRPKVGDKKPDEHKVVPPLIRADSAESVVNISSDDTPMEINTDGTSKPEASVPTPVVCLSPKLVKDEDIIYVPGTRTVYGTGTRLGVNDYPIDTDQTEMTEKSPWFMKFKQKAVDKEIIAREIILLSQRNTKISDSRKSGDYDLERKARQSYINQLQHTADSINKDYKDSRTRLQKSNPVAEAYASVIPDHYIPGKRSEVHFVQDMFKGKAYPWVDDLIHIPEWFSSTESEYHDLAGLMPRLYRTSKSGETGTYLYFPSNMGSKDHPDFDYRTAIYFPSAMQVLAFYHRAEYKKNLIKCMRVIILQMNLDIK
jgi:hypothetical protein